MEEFDERLEVSGSQYGGLEGGAVIGCIINHVPDPHEASLAALRDDLAAKSRVLERGGFHLIGAIPLNPELTACRTIDIARHLGAKSAARRRDSDPPGQKNFPARAHRAKHAPHLSGGVDLGHADRSQRCHDGRRSLGAENADGRVGLDR